MTDEPDNLVTSSDVIPPQPWWRLEPDTMTPLTKATLIGCDVIGLMGALFSGMTDNGPGIIASLVMTILGLWVINGNDPTYD